jgi:hypothetical protein
MPRGQAIITAGLLLALAHSASAQQLQRARTGLVDRPQWSERVCQPASCGLMSTRADSAGYAQPSLGGALGGFAVGFLLGIAVGRGNGVPLGVVLGVVGSVIGALVGSR